MNNRFTAFVEDNGDNYLTK